MFKKTCFDNKVELKFDWYNVTISDDDSLLIEKKIIVYNPSEITAVKSKLKNEFWKIDFKSLRSSATKNSISKFAGVFNLKPKKIIPGNEEDLF